MTREQSIELITQREALYHVEMAWRAQQRLVRRCLGLRMRLSSENDHADDAKNKNANVNGDDGGNTTLESGAAKSSK